MDGVVVFVFIEFSGHVLLAEHGSHSGVRSVGVEDVGLVPVRECEYDVAEETLLEVFEGPLLHRSPVPNPFPGQGCKGEAMVANCGKN